MPATHHSIRDLFMQNLSHYNHDCKMVDGELQCFQRPHKNGAIRVGTIGDSITAVGHTSSIGHHYPDQLQTILDAKHGNGTYSVTNLGICGSTLQKESPLPWSVTPAYKALVENRWDVIIVMLGTNDAAPNAQGYWPAANHEHCDNADLSTLSSCNL